MFALFCLGLCACQPQQQDAAPGIVAALHYDAYYDTISSLAVEAAMQRLQDKGMAGDELAAANTKLKDVAAQYKTTFLEKIMETYRTRFSADELAKLLAFYQSPLGQKVGQEQKSLQDTLSVSSRDAGVFIGVAAAGLVH